MSTTHDICDPVAPAWPYLGGKKLLASRIIARLRAIEHSSYVEPFVGAGGIFLRRPWRVKAEIINDRSRDVANLFRILQRHYVALMDCLRWQITSRAEFERLVAANADTLTDLERACRFLFLQRTAFGGKILGRNFGVSPANAARFDVSKLASILEAVHERLSGVVIECLPYGDLIRRYDRHGTLFYLDPSYYGSEDDYGRDMFGREDFERLAEMLRALQGRFVLSLNDRPEVRDVFSGFTLENVETGYSIAPSGTGRRRFREVLITL